MKEKMQYHSFLRLILILLARLFLSLSLFSFTNILFFPLARQTQNKEDCSVCNIKHITTNQIRRQIIIVNNLANDTLMKRTYKRNVQSLHSIAGRCATALRTKENENPDNLFLNVFNLFCTYRILASIVTRIINKPFCDDRRVGRREIAWTVSEKKKIIAESQRE
jgi:hypothetical protein